MADRRLWTCPRRTPWVGRSTSDVPSAPAEVAGHQRNRIVIESNISKMVITETDCILAMLVRQVRSRHGPRPAISRHS